MKSNVLLSFVVLFSYSALFGQSAPSELFQLADPMISSKQTFFKTSTQIELILGMENVALHYTLDGHEPSRNSKLFEKAFALKQSAHLKVKAFHTCCRSSETVEAQFFKVSPTPLMEILETKPEANERYAGNGAKSLDDHLKGSTNFHEPTWLGFAKKDLSIFYKKESNKRLKKVTVSTISDPNSWIFPPKGLELWASSDGTNYELLAQDSFPILTAMEKPKLCFLSLNVPSVHHSYYKLIVKNTQTIPSWHLRAGNGTWLFVDEIIWQ